MYIYNNRKLETLQATLSHLVSSYMAIYIIQTITCHNLSHLYNSIYITHMTELIHRNGVTWLLSHIYWWSTMPFQAPSQASTRGSPFCPVCFGARWPSTLPSVRVLGCDGGCPGPWVNFQKKCPEWLSLIVHHEWSYIRISLDIQIIYIYMYTYNITGYLLHWHPLAMGSQLELRMAISPRELRRHGCDQRTEHVEDHPRFWTEIYRT